MRERDPFSAGAETFNRKGWGRGTVGGLCRLGSAAQVSYICITERDAGGWFRLYLR